MKTNDPKLIQTNVHLWDSHDLDDGNKKLIDITQNSSHPNKLEQAQIMWVLLKVNNV